MAFKGISSLATSETTSLTITKPASTASGDLMIALLARGGALTSGPSGWTQISNVNDWTQVWYRYAGGSEPANYTWTAASAGIFLGRIILLSGRSAGTPICGAQNQTSYPNATALSVDSPNLATDLIYATATTLFESNSITPPSGMTEQSDDVYLDTGGSYSNLEIATSVVGVGATGNKTGTATGTGGAWFSVLVAAPYPVMQANLQGVATMTPQAQLVVGGQASLQGVATMTPQASLSAKGEALFQGVGTLTGMPDQVPALDFTVFDAYVDGLGTNGALGLIFYEDDQSKPATINKRLQPTRQDVGNNPFELRPDTGDLYAQGDFSHGAGQLYYHHTGRDDKAYFWSEGWDVSDPGVLRHLHDTALVSTGSVTTSAKALCQFNSLPFVADGNVVKRGDGNFPGTWTSEDPNLAEGSQAVNDLASDGEFLYAALGTNGIHKRNTSGTWTHFSAVAATVISYVKSRLMAGDGRIIYEINMSTGAGTTLETLPSGWTFTDIFEAGAFIFACAVNPTAGLSAIHSYGLVSGSLQKVGETPMPRNQLAYSGCGYLNAAYIGVGKINSSGGYDPVVYQAFPDDSGFLALVKLTEGKGSTADLSILAFEPIGEAMLFGWSLGAGYPFGARDGIAIHDFVRDAFSSHLKAGASGSQVKSILFYKGRIMFTVLGQGLYYEDVSKKVSQATIIPSIGDWGTSAPKVWDRLTISHTSLPAGTSVHVDYAATLPESAAWSEGLISQITGSDGATSTLANQKSRFFAIRIRSFAKSDQTVAPEVTSFEVRSNLAQDSPEYTLTRFVRLMQHDMKDEQAEVVYRDPLAVRKILLGLPYTWVKLYEPGIIWNARIESVADVRPILPVYSQTFGETPKDLYVMQLMLAGTRN